MTKLDELIANLKPKAGMEEKAEKADRKLKANSKLAQATQELATVENLPTRVYANYRRLAKVNRWVANEYLEDWGTGKLSGHREKRFCKYCGSAQSGMISLRTHVGNPAFREWVHIRCWEVENKDVN